MDPREAGGAKPWAAGQPSRDTLEDAPIQCSMGWALPWGPGERHGCPLGQCAWVAEATSELCLRASQEQGWEPVILKLAK